jgi:hypothetical protein
LRRDLVLLDRGYDDFGHDLPPRRINRKAAALFRSLRANLLFNSFGIAPRLHVECADLAGLVVGGSGV